MRFAFGDATGEGFVQTVNLVFVCPFLIHYALLKRGLLGIALFADHPFSGRAPVQRIGDGL